MIEGMQILGENLNATRKLIKSSKKLVEHEGRWCYQYIDLQGATAYLDVADAMAAAIARDARLIPYIAEGIKQRDARWAQATAVAQIKAGADFLDLCVDECTTDPKARGEHLRWLIETVAPVAGQTALTVDSSDSSLIRQGLELIASLGKRSMVNSINLEPGRRSLIPDVAKYGALVVANASGEKGLPGNTEERVANLNKLQDLMEQAGIPMGNRYLDPLVLPIGTDPQNGNYFFLANKAIREQYPDVHLIGGLSNVSFGLPNRAILNNAMMYLAKKYGADAAIVDPLQITRFLTEDPAFEYAVNALEGRDAYCAEFTAFCRS
ncbi:MAG: dihydropteroate synthase [Candidatus Sumerlaeota bacterium]|nr:dihydropteroate synthase [Candidatus Sumerlaeota bacterium]